MTGYSFDTFQTDEHNRDAARICREVAELRFTGDTPVVLVGPEGGGKSHLLWSIVKQLRAHDARASRALVMAREFPDRVRQLAAHPAPIQNGRPAVLLIDELERFEQDKEDLEDLVRVFLQNGHPVVAASRVHPDRLSHFDESFRALLRLGQVVTLDRAASLAPAGPGEVASLRAECDQLRAERDALEQQLAARAPQLAEINDLHRRLEAAEAERDRLAGQRTRDTTTEQLRRDHQLALEGLREELASMAVDRDAARDERDLLEQQLAQRAEGATDLIRVTQAQEKAREAQLRAEAALAESEAERESVAARLAALEHRAVSLVSRLRDGRFAWQEGIDALGSALDRLQAAVTHRGPGQEAELEALESELGDARALATSYRVQLDQERAEADGLRAEHERHVAALEASNTAVADELATTWDHLEAERAKLRAAEFELEKARRQNALAAVELDALRHEAAAQVARANIQAGEMENRAKQLQEALDILRETGRAAAQDSLGVQRSVDDLARAAQTLEARLRTFNNIALPYGNAEDTVETLQPILFEPSAIKSAAETLDTLAREWKALESGESKDAEDVDDSDDGPKAMGQSAF